MALLDYIELSDDEKIVVPKKNDEEIVELSSDEETAEETHNGFTYGSPGQHPTTLHDEKSVFVAEGEGEATEFGNADEATPSSSATEKGPLGTAASQICPHTQTAVSFPRPTSVSVKALTFEPAFVAEGEGEATESGNADKATPSSSIVEKGSLDTAASQNCHHTPTAASFPGPASISVKALTFEACDANMPGVKRKRRKKLFHNDKPWKNPRLECKYKDCSKSMEELAVDLKRSRMLEEQNTSSRSKKKNKLSLRAQRPASISTKAVSFEACDANMPRVKRKRRKKLFHNDTPWRSPRLECKYKDRSKSMEDLAVDLKRSRMLEEQNTSARSKKNTLSLCAQCKSLLIQ